MQVTFGNARFDRDAWSVSAQGACTEGIHLVSGDTGSGKTTLALMIAGLLAPTSGTVKRESISSLLVSFQFPEYHVTGRTVNDECASWDLDPRSILPEARLTGKEDLSPLKLSRGELKRLHLACVLSRESDLLVLDEPFSSLDCVEKARFCGAISRRTRGITIIFTHEQEHFPRVDRIWEIVDGSLQCRGSIPDALPLWQHAPEVIRTLVRQGKIPANLTREDIVEAACRT
jgi:energy-coupling factor transport system ATP-binding protein